MVLLALGIDEALRVSDPYRPHFAPANMDNVLKWGMDCPDAAYTGAGIRGDATYVVRGRRNTVRYLGFQVMGGMENTGNVVADDLELDADGRFELVLSATEHPGNWMPLTPGSSSLVVRQFFYDWTGETPAELSIECTDRPPDPEGVVPDPLLASGIGSQLEALGEFMEASLAFWLDVEEAGRNQGVNCFRPPAALTGMGAAAENVSTWGSWSLRRRGPGHRGHTSPGGVLERLPGELLVGDHRLRQPAVEPQRPSARLDPDGVFRAVVSRTDPGVANWLDTTGNHHGAMIFRWLRADGAPVPAVRTVPIAELKSACPGDAPDRPEDRRRVIGARRAAVQRRFPALEEGGTMDWV